MENPSPTPSTAPVLPQQVKQENKTVGIITLLGIGILLLIQVVMFIAIPAMIMNSTNDLKNKIPAQVEACVEPNIEVVTTDGTKSLKLGKALELLVTTLSAEHGKIYEACGGEPTKQ